MQNELEASFLYVETRDQIKATADVKTDMESENPMDRLICGDVGLVKLRLRSEQTSKQLTMVNKLQF